MLNYSWMSTCSGRLEDHTAPSSAKGCLCMPPRWGRKKQRGWSAEAVGMACQGWIQRLMYLPSSLWGIKPDRRFGTSTTKYTYSKGFPTHHPAGPNGCKRPSKTSCLPWGATYKGEEVLLNWMRTKGGLPWLPHGPSHWTGSHSQSSQTWGRDC